MPSWPPYRHLLLSFLLLFAASPAAMSADDKGWIDLTNLDSWRKPVGKWLLADSVGIDPDNPRLLSASSGKSILVNGPKGREHDLLSKQEFGDLEVHIEFLIPKKSNSGVKLLGLYEIQISDSWGLKELKGDECGGIYPRADLKPKYHYLDKGVPPRRNACKKPGEWQTLDILFQAPRFDDAGKKTASARFVRVVLNGEVIHENVETPTPTGHAWTQKEVATGPLLLQGDHGPVAFRNVRVRPRPLAVKKD